VGPTDQREWASEREARTDVRGPLDRERPGACEGKIGADNPAPPASGRERERERAWPGWAGLGLMGQIRFFFF
jgi:hypothetical protein